MQQVTDLKKKSKYIKFTSLNENILHTCVNIDEYAGVIEREEKRQKDEINAHLAMDHGNLSDAVDVLEKVDPYMDDKVIELAKKLVDEEGISEESACKEAKRILAARKQKAAEAKKAAEEKK